MNVEENKNHEKNKNCFIFLVNYGE